MPFLKLQVHYVIILPVKNLKIAFHCPQLSMSLPGFQDSPFTWQEFLRVLAQKVNTDPKIQNDPDAEKDWRQEEKRETQDEIVDGSWHHQLNGHEFEQTPGDSKGQGSLTCCSPRQGVRHDWVTEQQDSELGAIWSKKKKKDHQLILILQVEKEGPRAMRGLAQCLWLWQSQCSC